VKDRTDEIEAGPTWWSTRMSAAFADASGSYGLFEVISTLPYLQDIHRAEGARYGPVRLVGTSVNRLRVLSH